MKAKLAICNQVLASFAPDSAIIKRTDGWAVSWMGPRGPVTKRWSCSGQDFYPVWHKRWAHGGTATTALSQLIRWLRGKPVLPIGTWRYWASEKISLLPLASVAVLEAGGYPKAVDCILCGRRLTSYDWWSLDGVSGPCCHYRAEGCQRKDNP